jgi:hypothetical protein
LRDRPRKLAVPKQFNFVLEGSKGLPIEKITEPYPLQKRIALDRYSPEIAAQWHYEKNCGWSPSDFSYGSGANVWWRCDQASDHVWRQTIAARATRHGSCPFCIGQRVSVTNSLAKTFPKVAKEWHPARNTAKATEVTAHANYLAWWRCSKKHEWMAVINNRTTLKAGCPECYDEKRIAGLSDYPEYLKYFDYAKNKGIDPMKLLIGKPVWWKCNKAKDHRWKMGFWKTHVAEACPFCRGYRASSTNNLALEKSLMKDFDTKLNPGIKPKEVPLGSGTVLTWKCKKCSHIWKAKVADRYQSQYGCRKCAQAERWKKYYKEKKVKQK